MVGIILLWDGCRVDTFHGVVFFYWEVGPCRREFCCSCSMDIKRYTCYVSDIVFLSNIIAG